MNPEYEQIRRESMEWIQPAGELARQRLGSAESSRKADRSLVTDVDHAVQALLLKSIAERFPEDGVITEETQKAPGRHATLSSAQRIWVIDPIDGTRNYARGLPTFTVSVAVMTEGRPVIGFVYDPMTYRMYSASEGSGTWVNERQVTVSAAAGGDIFIGIPSGKEEPLSPVVHEWIDNLVLRATGSTALNLALLASGGLDAVFTSKCSLWDMAAGALLVTEAGGRISRHDGSPFWPMDLVAYRNERTPFLAARDDLWNPLLQQIQQVG